MLRTRIKNSLLIVGITFGAVSYGADTDNTPQTVNSPQTTTISQLAAQPATNLPPTLALNGEQWKLGFHEDNANFLIAEYVLENQTVDNWQQMFTYQKFKMKFPDKILLVNFADEQIAELKKRGYDVKYTLHSSSADEVILEFQVKNPVTQQQDELQRIVKAPTEFYILHYVTKQIDMGDTARNKWIAALKAVNVTNFEKA